ncbi:MAG: acylneuraminate cytidylyltransferase family protein [Caldimonas sp.]
MIGSKRVLALIPARGGSKGLPGKNILPVGGRPLLAWTAEAALGARDIDRVVVSSDDAAILAAGRACGVDALPRPAALASDTAATIEVVLHALDALPGFDVVVLLQPTSPLRNAGDVDAAMARFVASGAPACVSVSEAAQSPYWMYRLDDDQTLRPILDAPAAATRRQDLPPVYALNGAIYIADVAWLRRGRAFVGPGTVAHVMPVERALDIDTASDFALLRIIIEDSKAGLDPASPSVREGAKA